MAGQSLMMGDAFGKGFQYGKRKISSMSNEEFNALTPEDLARTITTDYTAIIQQMGPAFEDSRAFQSLILQELGNIIKTIPSEIRKFFGIEDAPLDEEETESNPIIPPDAYNWGNAIASFLSGAGVAGTNFNLLKTELENFFAPIFEFADSALQKGQEIVDRFLEKIEEEPEQEPLDEETQEPTEEQKNTVLTPTFVNTLSQGDLNIGGQRTRNFKGTIMQWTGTHMIINRGVDSWSIRLWKKLGTSGNGWVQIDTINGGTQQAIAQINTIKNQMGSSYVVQFPKTGTPNRWYLISDGHVQGFK